MSAVLGGDFDTRKCRHCKKDTKYMLCPKCNCCEWCHKKENGTLMCEY